MVKEVLRPHIDRRLPARQVARSHKRAVSAGAGFFRLSAARTGSRWRRTRCPASRTAACPQAHRAGARASSKSREPTSAMAVRESGLGSSADGEGEEGIDRSFERTGILKYLGE